MIHSAGIAIIYDNNILLGHPTGSGDDMWGIPKGKIEKGENNISASIRETYEEVGLDIPDNLIKDLKWNTITYKNAKNKSYKKVHYCVLKIESLDIIDMNDLIIDDKNLEKREIDKCLFMSKKEAEKKMFWRFKEMLENLI